MTHFFALFPILSASILIFSYRGKWRSGAMLAVALSCVSIIIGYETGVPITGILYTVIFLSAGFLPLVLRNHVQIASRDTLAKKLFLQSEVANTRAYVEKLSLKRSKLQDEMEQISRRYAFAKSLVAHLEGKPILQDLSSVFTAEQYVLGFAFSTFTVRDAPHPLLFEDTSTVETMEYGNVFWTPVFINGWINQDEWEKILKNVEFPADLSTSFIVIDLLSQTNLKPFNEFRKLLLLGVEKRKEMNDSLFLVGVPVRWDGKVQGMLTFVLKNALPKHFLDEVSVYAQLLGLGLRKTSLYRMVLEHSRRDGLTNLYLRHILLERLGEEINFTKRYGTSFSLLMLDLDLFKSVNDTYGHQTGDTVLKEVVECMKRSLHPGVTICRYGGEEFAVLIGLAPHDEVLRTAERLRESIACNEMRISEKSLLKVTVSIGVAHHHPDITSPEELIRRADNALYRAKEGGRNRVCEWVNK